MFKLCWENGEELGEWVGPQLQKGDMLVKDWCIDGKGFGSGLIIALFNNHVDVRYIS